MTSQPTRRLRASMDMIVLGTVGLGVIAWLTRKVFFSSQDAGATAVNTRTASPTSSNASTVTNSPKKPERNFVKVMQQQDRRVIFFYGSQTGTAEDFAARLAKDCHQKYGVNAMTADIELFDLTYLDTLPNDSLAVFVMATYGEGEPTDNAVDFWEMLMNDAPQFSSMDGSDKPLKQLRYIVFGLGNKTYEHYNEVARSLDNKLTSLGAERIGERGEGDDDSSLEEDFLAWQDTMWPAFCKALGVDENSARAGPREPAFGVDPLTSFDEKDVYYGELAEKSNAKEVIYDAKRPYNAPLSSRQLFKQGSDRHCLHLDIDISGTNLSYQTGDHVAIWPTNNSEQISRLASLLGLGDQLDSVVKVQATDPAASKQHPFPTPSSYRAIFSHYLDICAIPSRAALASLVEFAPNDAVRDALQQLASDKDHYKLHVSDAVRNLGEVLEYVLSNSDDPSASFANVPFDLIVECVSRLQPRYYSISSSAKEQPTNISATAVTLAYNPEPTPERTVYGVNTNYLYRIHAAQHQLDVEPAIPDYDLAGPRNALFVKGQLCKLPVHVRRSQFKLPRNTSLPVIMIGPGTGVAPFRGFVRERAAIKRDGRAVGPTILFFGCRHSQQDFLYDDEWPDLFKLLADGDDNGQSRLITAFSRESDQKVYVQHRLKEHGENMWNLLQKGAYIYVCGDAKSMAKCVNETIVELAQQFGDRTPEKANAFVKQLRASGRYQEDVWS
ncbi:NADPH-dependent cytochrome P450 oxidoreductase [Gongronella butleri]|nr:NADPH-dependent cytochrome P450 oxidoreductase [Gongronella butleri]